MKRRTLVALTSTVLASTLMAAPTWAQEKTLKIVAHSDLKILDPTFTTAYITRNFGHMVYDTLFAQDASGKPQPQMVEKYTTSKDGLQWSFTLRPGLKFADGSAVTSKDAVASINRWMSRDSMGKLLKEAGAQFASTDANTFTLTLKESFGLVIDALARPSSYPVIVMPERLASQPTTAPLTEVMGSGPFIFKRDEWVPGNKAVFVRNPHYVGRKEEPSGLAGNKTPKVDRVEWLYLPDANSSVAALKRGEVDYVEQVAPDYITPLRADKDIKIVSGGTYQGFMVFNHLHAPFNHPKARQAVQMAVNQEKVTAAMGFPKDMRVTYCATFFICGGPNATEAGAEAFRKPDIAKAKQLLAESGYKGEKVVLLVPTDVTYLNAGALMTAQTLRSIGVNVDMQNSDWASIGARRAKRDLPSAGGWNMYFTVGGEFDANSPVTNAFLGASCGSALPGWPCDEQLDKLRQNWIKAPDAASRKAALDAFQIRAYEAVPYAMGGQYSAASAARASLKGIDKLWAGMPNVWMLDK